MWTRNLCLICIYILRNNAFQITNEASFLAFLQPAATRLKFLLSSSSRLSKTSSAYSFTIPTPKSSRHSNLKFSSHNSLKKTKFQVNKS